MVRCRSVAERCTALVAGLGGVAPAAAATRSTVSCWLPDQPRSTGGGLRVVPAGVQRAEHIVQSLGELADGEHPQPGRGQLDGERQPVEPLHHPTQIGRLGRVRLPTAAGRRRPVQQQRHRVALRAVRPSGRPRAAGSATPPRRAG